MLKLSDLKPQPTGFGRCGSCPYYETAPAALCFSCARQSMENLAQKRCIVCDLPHNPGEEDCKNPICHWDNRYFGWNYAVAMKSLDLERAIKAYKFEDRKGWSVIFARVLVGFMNEESEIFEDFDLIVASPTYVSRDGVSRTWDHTRRVLSEAYSQSHGRWPFDVG